MDIKLLYEILAETCVQYRKGDEVTVEQVGPVEVTHVYAMPPVHPEKPGEVLVDMHFFVAGIDAAKAEARKADLISVLNDWPDPVTLEAGPSYITVGGIIGDQGAAFSLFALGKVLGLWNIITPESFGMTGVEASRAAGSGFIMITGYTTKKDAA